MCRGCEEARVPGPFGDLPSSCPVSRPFKGYQGGSVTVSATASSEETNWTHRDYTGNSVDFLAHDGLLCFSISFRFSSEFICLFIVGPKPRTILFYACKGPSNSSVSDIFLTLIHPPQRHRTPSISSSSSPLQTSQLRFNPMKSPAREVPARAPSVDPETWTPHQVCTISILLARLTIPALVLWW